jgi:hypothetical protein
MLSPFMDHVVLSHYLTYVSELKSRQKIKTLIIQNLPLSLNVHSKKKPIFLYLNKTNNIDSYKLPSYIKGVKVIIEGRTSFISMSSRKLKYLFV